ncbi:hypothetical protein LGW42_09085 [Streptococcus mutans]|nr:hypothetical protein [Streptococcus mutans]
MRIVSSLVSLLLTIFWIFAIAFIPIGDQNSFNKPILIKVNQDRKTVV